MKILIISDTESPALYEHYNPLNFQGIDLVLSAGDLNAHFLSYIASQFLVPVLYVHGNHDRVLLTEPPEGCTDIDGKLYNYKGVRFFGLGGCMAYSGDLLQFNESQMRWRWRFQSLKLRKGFDIFLTHAPARGYGDAHDLPHRGFQCFVDIIDRYKPQYMIHGHMHLNYGQIDRIHHRNQTKIVNAYGYSIIEI